MPGGNACGLLRLGSGTGTHLVAGGFQVDVKGIEGCHGHLGAPIFDLLFRPASIQADGASDVFRKSVTEIPFADEDVANETAGAHVENAAAGLPPSVGEAQENFASFGEFLTVIPRLGRVDLGMMAAGAFVFGLKSLHFISRIEIEDALAGIADYGLLAGAHIVVGLDRKSVV